MASKALKTVVVESVTDLSNMDDLTAVVRVRSNSCNDAGIATLDLSPYSSLQELTIGSSCFANVVTLNVTGLQELRKVEIGENSFTKRKNSFGYDPNRHFYLKNCNNVKELRIGQYSFSDYSSVEIHGLPVLESMTVGDLSQSSYNMLYASLELKSLPKLKSVLFGKESFRECNRVVFESD